MESTERLERQLHSLDELRGIVGTMKALSAASIRQYENAVEALAGYYRTVERGLHVVARDLALPPSTARRADRQVTVGAIVFGSDHGLCGRFNDAITEYTLEKLADDESAGATIRLAAVGERAAANLEHEGRQLDAAFAAPGSAARITTLAQHVLMQVDQWRTSHMTETVRLYYNRHADAARYEPGEDVLLPLDLARFRRLDEGSWPSRRIPQYSMRRRALLQRLLHQYLFVMIFRACAESQASEHASRLAAMQDAERNLDERIDHVTMSFRRVRQDAITSELLDVVAGFEAITSVNEGSPG